nr:MAG TPA_asm: hypothetical protein [Caudoviricetes sp.]
MSLHGGALFVSSDSFLLSLWDFHKGALPVFSGSVE